MVTPVVQAIGRSRYSHALLATLHRRPIATGARRQRSAPRFRWFRTCIAWYALLALVWPSLGPLPYLVRDFGIQQHGTHAHAGVHDDDHVDASAIPGSPTHPIDHDCPECEVLKCLAGCILPSPGIAILPLAFVGVVGRAIIPAPPRALFAALLPPVRAPPPAAA
jgi:hypothetical protein